jgi:hypothetical protein
MQCCTVVRASAKLCTFELCVLASFTACQRTPYTKAVHLAILLYCILFCAMQVRPAEGHSERDNKLFVGMVPKTADEAELREVFRYIVHSFTAIFTLV